MTHPKWKVLQHQDISPSPWLPVFKDEVELPSGKKITYFKSMLPDVAMVLAITKEREIIFVRQYKHGVGEVTIEFPAGRIESGVTPVQAAVLELAEETGITVTKQECLPLAELTTEPSKSSVHLYGFLVKDVEISQPQKLEETEDIEVLKVKLSELDDFILSETFFGSDTLALLLMARVKFPEVMKQSV